MNECRRFDYISDMKTVALLGVVFGHCLLFYVGNPFFPETAGFISKSAMLIITFFDASLISGFVFCSGFLFANSISRKNRTVLQNLANRIKRLLIPYYLYGALWVVPLYTFFNIKCFGRPENANYLTGYKYMLLGCFSDHLWFLWMLFWVASAFILMKPLLTKKLLPLTFVISVGLAFIVQIFLTDFPYFKLSQTAPYFICYFIGICAFHFIERIEKIPTLLLFILTAIFFIGSMFYYKADGVHFALGWLCKLCGILTSFCFFTALERFEAVRKIRTAKLWRYTEEHSMQLFLFNCPFVYLYFRVLYPLIGQYTFLCAIANFIITMLTLYVTVWIQDKIKELVRKNAKK